MNTTNLIGRITKDVELRQTASGTPVATFTLAVNRRFAKEGQPTADFINCVAWKQQAEFITKYFGKGRMIGIVGHLQTRSWEGQDGNKHFATEVIVDEVHFTGEKKEDVSGKETKPESIEGFMPPIDEDGDLPF